MRAMFVVLRINGNYYFSFKLEDERPITKITRGTFLIKEGNEVIPNT